MVSRTQPLSASHIVRGRVVICSKCGRGMIGEIAMAIAIDSQPVWYTWETNGPDCNGALVLVDREEQIRRYDASGVETRHKDRE